MIRNIIISALIILGIFFFYKKFMASSVEPFFKQRSGNVDFIQKKVPDYKVSE